ncbi:MAG: hypothetical protein ABSG55_02705 [Dehalococcoidia bacterium]|jgi:hypothetical protein
MDWSNLLPIPKGKAEVTVERKSLSLEISIRVDTFQECQPKEVRNKRMFWREDRVFIVHKEYGGDITVKPLT